MGADDQGTEIKPLRRHLGRQECSSFRGEQEGVDGQGVRAAVLVHGTGYRWRRLLLSLGRYVYRIASLECDVVVGTPVQDYQERV